MSSTDRELNERHLDSIAEIAAGSAGLPAVATVDWCVRAAQLVRVLKPNSLASVTLAELGPAGALDVLEATGASGLESEASAEMTSIHSDDATSIGWWFEPPTNAGAALAAPLRDLPCAAQWARTLAGRRWGRAGARDLLVGLVGVRGRAPGRALLVELGAPAGEPLFDGRDAAVLRAVLPHLARRTAVAFGLEPSSVLTRLTQREQRILDELAMGKSVKEIARELTRSPHTVHDHVKSLHRKLNATSRGALIARALGHLVSESEPTDPGGDPAPLAATPGPKSQRTAGAVAAT